MSRRTIPSLLPFLVLALAMGFGVREAVAAKRSIDPCPYETSPPIHPHWKGDCGANCNSDCLGEGAEFGSCEYNAEVGKNCCFCTY